MKRVALIGSPLRRRHSEAMHNAAFEHFAIDARYELRPLRAEDLDGFFADARGEDWLGFQVTAPYKQEALARCDEVEETALRIGAVNSTVRRSDGSLLGFNTDAPGFAFSVGADLGVDLRGAAVCVAGAGGAARAVVAAALERGAGSVVVGNRSRDRAVALVDHFADDRLAAVALEPEFEGALAAADLAVNATTVGMTDSGVAFDVRRLPVDAAVFDLVYVPFDTPLVTAARGRGLKAVNGAGMLVAQAAIAFQRWTGVDVGDVAPVMRRGLEPLWTATSAEAT